MAQLTLQEQHMDGFTILDLGETALVMSQSKAGDWYAVAGDRCSCAAATYREGPCKHVVAVAHLRNAQFERQLRRMLPFQYVEDRGLSIR